MQNASAMYPVTAASLLAHTKLQRIGSGVQQIDEALKGGVDFGVGGVTCISGDKGVGKTGLAFAFLASLLLSSTTKQAVLVDTTGTFDVLRLYHVILSRLASNEQPHEKSSRATERHASVAEDALERVKIIRVFDFAGLTEAVAEVREKTKAGDDEPMAVAKKASDSNEESPRPLQRIKGTIPDSEDDLEDEDDDAVLPAERADSGHGQVGMIIVDNIAQVVGPTMKNNYVKASAQLTTLLRSLSQLAELHSLGAILVNAMIPVPGGDSARNKPQLPPLSIFASARHMRPALSPILVTQPDLHLLITTHHLNHQRRADKDRCELVNVVEVLSDRYEDRVGRWAMYAVDEAGLIVGVDPCG